MKKTLLTALLIAGAATVYGQGTIGNIQWGNSYTSSNFRSLIYGPDTNGNPSAIHVGQSANTLEIPTGSTVYNGPLLQGTGWTFAFFAAPQILSGADRRYEFGCRSSRPHHPGWAG